MPERITPEQLAAIVAYTNAASGPLLLFGHPSWAGENTVLTDEGHPVAVCGHGEVAAVDAEFFARIRSDAPKLIAEVVASHGETVTLAEQVRNLTDERERARDAAVALEQENARLQGLLSAAVRAACNVDGEVSDER